MKRGNGQGRKLGIYAPHLEQVKLTRVMGDNIRRGWSSIPLTGSTYSAADIKPLKLSALAICADLSGNTPQLIAPMPALIRYASNHKLPHAIFAPAFPRGLLDDLGVISNNYQQISIDSRASITEIGRKVQAVNQWLGSIPVRR